MATTDYSVVLTQDVNTLALVAEGAQGASGGFFAYSQGTSSDTWIIDHNLGYNPGGVMIVDSVGNIVEGAYEYTNTNQLIATFSGEFSGWAYLS